jgi:hypothetical protein
VSKKSVKKPSRLEVIKELVAMQEGIVSLERELKHAVSDYKAKTKEYFGVEDGQPLNLVQLLMVMDRVI